jgi:hypothetical protein
MPTAHLHAVSQEYKLGAAVIHFGLFCTNKNVSHHLWLQKGNYDYF